MSGGTTHRDRRVPGPERPGSLEPGADPLRERGPVRGPGLLQGRVHGEGVRPGGVRGARTGAEGATYKESDQSSPAHDEWPPWPVSWSTVTPSSVTPPWMTAEPASPLGTYTAGTSDSSWRS